MKPVAGFPFRDSGCLLAIGHERDLPVGSVLFNFGRLPADAEFCPCRRSMGIGDLSPRGSRTDRPRREARRVFWVPPRFAEESPWKNLGEHTFF